MAEYPIGQRYLGSGVTMPGLAGETVPRGAAVYMSAVDGLWYLADSDAAATLSAVGIVSDAGTAGNVIQILVVGIIERSDWTWTRGDPIYVSGTAGVLTQIAPANLQSVAVALTATLIYVNPGAAGASATCGILEGATAFVGFDDCKEPFTNYFLVDGTADNVQIDAAINYVDGLGGGSVELERGTFTLAATVTMDENDIELRGQGWDTYLSGAAVATAVTVSGSRCQVKDLRVATTGGVTNNFDGISITGTDCIVERVWVSDSDRHGILVNGPNAKVQHNLIESVDDNGVSIGALGDDSIVSDNEIDTSGADGILIDAAGENCTVIGNRIASWTGEPIDDNSDTSWVADNNCGGDVMNSKGMSFATIQAAVDSLAGDGWVEVPEGTFSEAVTITDDGVILRGRGWASIIDGGTTGHAINSSGDRGLIIDLTVKTDVGQANNFDGIFASSFNYGRIVRVFVNGADRNGIHITGSTSTLVEECRIFDPDEDGIYINSAGGILGKNHINQCGKYGVEIQTAASDVVISDNKIDTTADDGVFIHTNGEDCVVDGNRITAWTNECIDDDSGTSTVGDNDCT